MTKRQRLMAAIKGETPDMVPVSPLVYDRYSYLVLGKVGIEAHFEVHQMIGSIHHRGNGHIGVKFHLPGGYREEYREIERGPDGRVVTETIWHMPHGTLRCKDAVGMIPHDPMAAKRIEYFVKDQEDWKIYRRWLEDQVAGMGEYTWEDYSRLDRIFGDDAVPGVALPSPFAHLMGIRDMAGLLTDLYDCPDLIQSVLDLERQMARRCVEAFLASPAELSIQDICCSTGASMSPKMFERWSLPDVVMYADLVRSTPGKYCGLYTLGRIRNLLSMFVDAGVHYVESFEPNEGDISLAEAKRIHGDHICLVGNFNCLVLAFGTADQARQETMRCLHEAMEGGRYVLATADEVPANTKMDNLKVMVETAEEFGRYD